MIAKTLKPATLKVQSDSREELQALIDAAEGFILVGKIAKMSGVYVANLIEGEYVEYVPENEDTEGGEG